MNKVTKRTREIPSFIVMDVLERAHELEREGRHIIHLEIGEPDFATPQCICEAAQEAIRKGNISRALLLTLSISDYLVQRVFYDSLGP